MDIKTKIDFQKTSCVLLSVYAVCIAALMLNAIDRRNFNTFIQIISHVLLWSLIVSPQFILFKFVYKFKVRWIQLTSLVLQIITCIATLYHHGKTLILMNIETQPVMTLVYIPIWECVIILALGLIMKLVQDY